MACHLNAISRGMRVTRHNDKMKICGSYNVGARNGILMRGFLQNPAPGTLKRKVDEFEMKAGRERDEIVTSSEKENNAVADGSGAALVVGEDAAKFVLANQEVSSWALFFGLLSGVLGLIYVLWIDPNIGVGSHFSESLETLAPNSEVAMLEILLVFAVAHSGLAYLRPYGERPTGHCFLK